MSTYSTPYKNSESISLSQTEKKRRTRLLSIKLILVSLFLFVTTACCGFLEKKKCCVEREQVPYRERDDFLASRKHWPVCTTIQYTKKYTEKARTVVI